MLELRPNCECCDADLSPATNDAMICSFECTFCVRCATDHLKGVCPNCSGDLVPRPVRPSRFLVSSPTSTRRVLREQPCPGL